MRLSVIIPAYNEEKTIAAVLTALFREVPNLYEAIVVDDGSKDNTAQIVEEFCQEIPRVRLIRQPSNQGKTAALRAGFAASTGEIVIVQDADLEYDPVDIPGLIEPIENGKADVVFGSRFLTRRASRILYFRHYMVAKLKCRVYEVPISYYGRTYEEGKKIGFKDGLEAIFYIFKYNLLVNREKSFRAQPKLDN
jgi:glycosyltransferase involved in cell wall biosynthesis